MLLEKDIKTNQEKINPATKIGIIVDDVCSLPESIIEKNKIEVVKTKLFFKEMRENPDKDIYQVMKETRASPKTSAPSPGEFLSAYKKSLNLNERIIVITMSSCLSGTSNAAFQAKKLMPDPSKIEIINSFSVVAAEGLLVTKALELIKKEKDIKKIKKELEDLKDKIKLFAFIKETYWVEKIGRITKKRAFGFKFLKCVGVLPIIGIKRGEVGLVGFNFWTTNNFKALFHQLKKQARKAKKQSKKLIVGINYTDNFDLALKMKEKAEKKLNAKVLFISKVPLIVGANSGPGTLISACYIE
jgi:DegV family protein with EDD domain